MSLRKEKNIPLMRAPSEIDHRRAAEAPRALRTPIGKLQSSQTTHFSTQQGFDDLGFAGCREKNKKVALDMSQSGNNGTSAKRISPAALDNQKRHQHCPSASQTSFTEERLADPDRRIDAPLGKSSVNCDNLQLDDLDIIRPKKNFNRVASWKLESPSRKIDSNDLKRSSASQPAYSSAQDLSPGHAIANEDSISPGMRLRGGTLSSVEYWNADRRQILLLGQNGLHKDELLIGSIQIEETIHDYLGGHSVEVHYKRPNSDLRSNAYVKLEA